MKNKIVIIIVVTFAVLLVGSFWFLNKNKKLNSIKEVDEKNREIFNIKPVNTNDWKTYRNEELGFKINYPENLILTVQNKFNKDSNLENIILYDNKFSYVADSPNPLIEIINKGSEYIKFDINNNNFVKKDTFDIKKFVSSGLTGPGGETYATQKIIKWESMQTVDSKTDMYLYKTDNIDVTTSEKIGQSEGIVWVSGGKLFIIHPAGKYQNEFYSVCKKIASTFSEN